MIKNIMMLLVWVALVGCTQGSDLSNAKTEEAAARFAAADQASGGEIIVERKLIKTGNLSMEVDDVKEVRKQVGDIVSSHKGYVSEERLDNYGDRLNHSMIIRVPAELYDTLVYSIEQVGQKVESKSVNVQDVTEEFIDIEARLNTKKELETRYREILKQAHTVSDIISVESNLNTVRGEIESMEGRLKYLSSQVSFSTLNLNFYQKLTTDFGFIGRIGDGFKNGWTNLLSFLIGLVNVWPFLIIIGGAIWGLVRWRKSQKAI
jgi:hypothetical protein